MGIALNASSCMGMYRHRDICGVRFRVSGVFVLRVGTRVRAFSTRGARYSTFFEKSLEGLTRSPQPRNPKPKVWGGRCGWRCSSRKICELQGVQGVRGPVDVELGSELPLS